MYFAGTAQDGGYTYRRTNMARIKPELLKQLVNYVHNEQPGTIVVDTKAHFLYVAFENNTALRYGVGVGKEGFKWFGRAAVDRKAEQGRNGRMIDLQLRGYDRWPIGRIGESDAAGDLKSPSGPAS